VGKGVRNVLFDGGVSAVWDILGGGVGVGGGSVVGLWMSSSLEVWVV